MSLKKLVYLGVFFFIASIPNVASAATKHIIDNSTGGDCTTIGAWNNSTKTCTLTIDLTDGIQVDSNGITLDGANHFLNGPGSGTGILLDNKNNITIKNLNISHFSDGISLYSSFNNSLINNTVSNNYLGIIIQSSQENILRDNSMSDNTYNFTISGGMFETGDARFNNDIGITNIINGKPLYYLRNVSNAIYDSSTNAGTVYCIDCNNITIKDLSINSATFGIYLHRTTNSTIENISIINSSYGIYFGSYSSNNRVIGNTISNTQNAIYIVGSNNLVEGNILNSNAIGLRLVGSTGNVLKNNRMSNNNYGFFIDWDNDSHLDNDIDITNTINNKPIYYIRNVSNKTYDSSTNAGIFYCINCNNVVFKDLNLTSNSQAAIFYKTNNSRIENISILNGYGGIHILDSTNNVISKNNISATAGGIYLNRSTGNKIIGNTLTQVEEAIYLSSSNVNILARNTIVSSQKGVIIANSINNKIFNNNFVNNTTQVERGFMTGGDNIFSLPLPIGGNYWSNFDSVIEGCNDLNTNGICDSSYNPSGWTDSYPWTQPQTNWPQVKDPVIIIPGLMGSYLNRVSNNSQVWPNTFSMIGSGADEYLNDLILNLDGKQISGFEMSPSGIIYSELGSNFYGNLVSAFTSNGYVLNENLFVMPYDWRLDVKDNFSLLSSTISEAFDKSYTGQIDVVAHSLGSILLKAYLASDSFQPFDKAIFAGSPQIGAPVGFKALNHGDNLNFKFGILNPGRIKIIGQNMPSIYELLPSRAYFTANSGGYVTDFRGDSPAVLDYDATKALMLANPDDKRNAGLLDVGDNFHQELDPKTLTANVYNIMGCTNWETIGGINIYGGNKAELVTTNGDGTVPLISASFNSGSYNKYFVKGSNHGGLVADNAPLNLIKNLIINNSNTLPGGISQSSSVCATGDGPSTKMYSTHSPVDLHLYDASGNHVGINEDGDIDLEIPGSKFESIDHNTFIFVPDGDYRVEIEATGVGSFDFKIREINNSGEVSEAITYLNIPIQDDSLVAKLPFGADEETALQIDADGDGDTDINMDPSAVLVGSENLDIIPSTTSISLSGTSGENSWYKSDVEVTLSAVDNPGGVGVYQTQYSLDNGTTWITYTSPFTISTEGIYEIQYISRDYVGNQKSPQIAIIKIDKTAPEAKIHFDPVTRFFLIDGTDNLSATTTTRINNETYLVKDQAGHTLKITLDPTYLGPKTTLLSGQAENGSSVLNLRVISLQYNSNPVITLPVTNLNFEWTNTLVNGQSILKTLAQTITILPKLSITALYDSLTNKTTVNKTENTTNITQVHSNLKLLNLVTKKGMVSVEY